MQEYSRDYINGQLAGLNILMIYAQDGKVPTVAQVQEEIDHVLLTPVKKEEPPKQAEVDKLLLKEKISDLKEFNMQTDKGIVLAEKLAGVLDNLPIFAKPVTHISGKLQSTIDGD